MKLRYASTAAVELDEIVSHLRQQSPLAVRRFRVQVGQAEARLRELPAMGRSVDSGHLPIRRLLLRPYPYLLFYQVDDAEVLIVGLRHAARDPASMPGVKEAER